MAAALLLAVGTSSTDPTPATILALLALGLSAAAAVGFGPAILGQLRERSVITILAVGIGLEVIVSSLAPAVVDDRFVLVLTLGGAAGLYALLASGTRQRVALLVVVVIHFGLMLWMFAVVPLRDMDVHLVQQEASAALLSGVNPYSITFENIYGYGTPLYPLEVQQGDRVNFGFPYPPLSLLMALPGYALLGDYRVGALAAVSSTALMIGFMRTGPLPTGAAVLLLLSPLTARVLHNGWTEPFVVIWLAVAVLMAIREVAATPIAIGLLIASKQYAPILLPLAIGQLSSVRARVGSMRMLVLAIAVALATVLPFLAWGPEDFWFSTVEIQLLQPLREDGATVAALLARTDLWVPPAWLGFVCIGAMALIVLHTAESTPSGFALATGVVLIVLFLFSRTAFMNYYFAAMVGLLCAVAATDRTQQTQGPTVGISRRSPLPRAS